MNARAALRAAGIAGLLAVAGGCATPGPSDPATVAVVQIGGRTHTLSELREYLDDNLLADEEGDLTGAEADAVKSRLFDAFVEELLLLHEAERRGIQVTDFEVQAYLGLAAAGSAVPDGGGGTPVSRSERETAGRRLKIEKLLEATVRELPPAIESPAPAPSPQESAGERRVRLRALMLETPELAAEVSREIRRGRVTFDEAVIANATAPEQGMPIELAWNSLSEDHRQVLEKLKPGGVSRPLEVGGGTYLFQIQAWLPAKRPDPEALAEEARRTLEEARRAEALRQLVSELQKNTDIRTFFESLPFPYVPQDSVEPPAWNKVSEGAGRPF